LTAAFGVNNLRNLDWVFYTMAEQLGDVYEGLIEGQGDEGIEIFATVSRATLDIIGLGGMSYVFGG